MNDFCTVVDLVLIYIFKCVYIHILLKMYTYYWVSLVA